LYLAAGERRIFLKMILQRHLCGWKDWRGLAEFMSKVPKNGRVRQVASTGIHAKQLQAAWKEDYLLKVLSAAN